MTQNAHSETEGDAASIAVLDMGKSNVKLSAVTAGGHVVETVSLPNTPLPGPPWQHHDVSGIGDWAMDQLAVLCRRHSIASLIATGHGSGGVLVLADPDAPDGGVALPMVDYEQPLPAEVDAAYRPLAGTFADRGSAIMQAATHQARQMLWMEMAEPRRFAKARWYLGLPQYWAWRFSGVAAAEYSFLGAQSHLWNMPQQRYAPIVAAQGWRHLMAPLAHAGQALAPLRPALVRHFNLPEGIMVHTGAHDSSTNFYRYQAAGLSNMVVVSTGTWIVALADAVPVETLVEARNMTINCDMAGHVVGGALTMGGREFIHVAGAQPPAALADLALVAQLVEQGTFAVPAFGADGGQFPGSASRGKTVGPPPQGPAQQLALAVLYMALLTQTCADVLAPGRRLILDGSYLRDPAYAAVVAALRHPAETRVNAEGYGVAAGAALLCGHARRQAPMQIQLFTPPANRALSGLSAYAHRWRELAHLNLTTGLENL
jgi:sugar (pentulose or hexulose) kinase